MTDMEPNTPVKGDWPGVSAIDVNGDRYCIDCAKKVLEGRTIDVKKGEDWHTVENADGNEIVSQIISGKIYTLGSGGALYRTDESPIIHCGRGQTCENSIPGDKHNYDHNTPVGGILDVVEVPH